MKLLRFVDKSLLPVAFLVFARYLGVFVAGLFYPIRFGVSLKIDHLSLPFVSFYGFEDYYIANSISWFFVGITLALYFGFTLFQTIHLHEDHIHPKQLVSLHQKYLEHLVIKSEDATYQIVGWLLLSTMAFLAAFLEFTRFLISVAIFSGLFSITIILIAVSLLHFVEKNKLKS